MISGAHTHTHTDTSNCIHTQALVYHATVQHDCSLLRPATNMPHTNHTHCRPASARPCCSNRHHLDHPAFTTRPSHALLAIARAGASSSTRLLPPLNTSAPYPTVCCGCIPCSQPTPITVQTAQAQARSRYQYPNEMGFVLQCKYCLCGVSYIV